MAIIVRPAGVLLLLAMLASTAVAEFAPFGRRLAQKDKCGGLTAPSCDAGAKKGWGCCYNSASGACGTCNLRPKMKQTAATCDPGSTVQPGGCLYTCTAKWGDCDNDMSAPDSNGCETNLQSSATNCGGCNIGCTAMPHALPACGGGKCVLGDCLSNFANCNKDDSDGCETSLLDDVANCGACGNNCTAGAGAVVGGTTVPPVPSCVNGVCTYA